MVQPTNPPSAGTKGTLPPQDEQPVYPTPLLLLIGAFGLIIILLGWVPQLRASFLGTQPHAYWFFSRASAVVAYALLWVSMAVGITITNRFARIWPGGPTAFDLHEYTSILGLAFALFHAIVLIADPFIHYTLDQVLLPFDSTNYRLLWVALGQIAFYGLVLVTVSFYVRRTIGNRNWRWLHYLSYPLFVLVALHGIFSGTDTGNRLVAWTYLLSLLSLGFLTLHRFLTAKTVTQP